MLRAPQFAFRKNPTKPPVVESSAPPCEELLVAATPTLYLGNPFRRLGLPVLASPREIFRRIDELKLSLELGTLSTPWAFAPETELTLNEIREASHKLKSPRDRLLYEFFWFWPENYPLEASDPALESLANGETAPALELWLRAADEGSRVARHNLAVYHHLLVLDWECLPENEESRLDAVWPQTLEYWLNIADDEPLWQMLRTRVEKIADPQLTTSFVGEIRSSLPAAVSKINAALLLNDAENGRADRVALQASLIALIQRDAVGVRRTLETSSAPVARRIDSYIVIAQREAADESMPALSAAVSLVRNCDDELRLVETLCGREDIYVELSNSVADAALNCLVAHQRRTQDDQSCLPVLVYLLNMEVTPELRRRLEDTYQVIRDNLVTASDSSTEHELEHQLIRDLILPHLDQLQLSATGRLKFTTRIAEWLGNLGQAAWHDLDDRGLARAMLATALELPSDATVRASIEEQFAMLDGEIQLQEKILQLARADHWIVVDADGIAFDEQRLAHGEITGLRYGFTENGFVVAWCSAEQMVVLDSTNLLAGDDAAADYTALVDAMTYFAVPKLVDRLLEAIRSNATVLVGEVLLQRHGVLFPTDAVDADAVPVPYRRLQHQLEDGQLVLADAENAARGLSQSIADVWNAAIIGSVIEALANEASATLN